MVDKCTQLGYNVKTMAEVAVLISTLRLGNCRRRKGNTAEECAGRPGRIFLGLRRRCAGLSSEIGRGADWVTACHAALRAGAGLDYFVKED